jgi:hypothetical protein
MGAIRRAPVGDDGATIIDTATIAEIYLFAESEYCRSCDMSHGYNAKVRNLKIFMDRYRKGLLPVPVFICSLWPQKYVVLYLMVWPHRFRVFALTRSGRGEKLSRPWCTPPPYTDLKQILNVTCLRTAYVDTSKGERVGGQSSSCPRLKTRSVEFHPLPLTHGMTGRMHARRGIAI